MGGGFRVGPLSRCPVFSTLKRFDKFTNELFDNPLFPLLFISETVKLSALFSIGEAPLAAVGVMAALSIPTTVGWYLFGKNIEEAVDEKAEEVAD